MGGRHIHHLVWGILLLLITGYAELAEVGTGDSPASIFFSRLLALSYGVGAALTLDEFALWLNLECRRVLVAARPGKPGCNRPLRRLTRNRNLGRPTLSLAAQAPVGRKHVKLSLLIQTDQPHYCTVRIKGIDDFSPPAVAAKVLV